MRKPRLIFWLLLLSSVVSGCSGTKAVLKNEPLYWPMEDGTAGKTYIFDERTELLTAEQYDAVKPNTVGMGWETWKWIRLAIEKLCAELKARDQGKETCQKEDTQEALDRVETAAHRFKRGKKKR